MLNGTASDHADQEKHLGVIVEKIWKPLIQGAAVVQGEAKSGGRQEELLEGMML